jgi:hypothetical protein
MLLHETAAHCMLHACVGFYISKSPGRRSSGSSFQENMETTAKRQGKLRFISNSSVALLGTSFPPQFLNHLGIHIYYILIVVGNKATKLA